MRTKLGAMEQFAQTKTKRNGERILRQPVTKLVPRRLAQLVRRPKWSGLTPLMSLGVLTVTVGLGYLNGVL